MPNYLALNKGSSSLKFSLYPTNSNSPILFGKLTNYMANEYQFVFTFNNKVETRPLSSSQYLEGSILVLNLIQELKIVDNFLELTVIHRIVHGGNKFTNSTQIDENVIVELEKLNQIAPLHNPPAIAEIKLLQKNFTKLKQIAVFDTAFHTSLPEINQIYALPIKAYKECGIKRFGFHGLSHKYLSQTYYKNKFSGNLVDQLVSAKGVSDVSSEKTLSKNNGLSKGKIVTLHLGSGSSLCAIKDGESYQTSMGFSPNEGLPMGTRSGEVNLEALSFYNQAENLSWQETATILNKKSGILGISGYTSNLVTIIQDYNIKPQAKFALDFFVERIIEKLGAYISVLDGAEAIIFSGAVGEGSHLIRQKICERFAFLGLNLDLQVNANSDECKSSVKISSENSTIQVWIIPTNEEMQMVNEVRENIL